MGVVPVPTSDLVALRCSDAMLRPGQTQPVDRDTLYELTAELVAARELLARLGADLRTVAQRGPGLLSVVGEVGHAIVPICAFRVRRLTTHDVTYEGPLRRIPAYHLSETHWVTWGKCVGGRAE